MVETKVYEINPVSRVINIPSSTVIGVESDENVERIRFQCDRFVGDNVDLSSFNLYVNYQNANGEKNVYLIEDVIADDSTIAFSWLLSREVTKYKGFIKFIVCAKRSNSTTNEWNTRVATASVIEGLEADAVIEEQKIDVLEQILARLTALEAGGGSGGGTVSPEDIQTAVDNYLDENPVQGAVSWSNKQIMLFEALRFVSTGPDKTLSAIGLKPPV